MEAFIATFYHYSTSKMALAINECLHICMYAQLYPSADFHEIQLSLLYHQTQSAIHEPHKALHYTVAT